ncbi:MAG: hypothetical protein AUJ52_07570 [Elusimicrobia bacterium CG1_02_63_36]|nr:MAG: hypothetical protein AUJ52_07570 [Elusimicrobia bacterium CG1_02_63_36]
MSRLVRETRFGARHHLIKDLLAVREQEPYYSQAQVFQYPAFNEGCHYGQPAVQSYELFLKAAPAGDARTA